MPQVPLTQSKHSICSRQSASSIRCLSSKKKASVHFKTASQHSSCPESVLRNCDGKKITGDDIRIAGKLAAQRRTNRRGTFVVARVLLQDFTGVPLLVDLAAMRSAVARLGKNTGVTRAAGCG